MDTLDERDVQHKHADHILLPITAAFYHNGMGIPAIRWSFEMAVGAHSDQNLHEFTERSRRGFGIFFILVSPEMLFFLSSDATSGRMMLYVLQESVLL